MNKPDWSKIEGNILSDLMDLVFPGPSQYNSEHALAFMMHVSENLTEALKRGNPKITESIILQLRVLKALHGIQLDKQRNAEFMQYILNLLKFGALFLL